GSEVEDENAIYNMSEETGTLRFMAPEVYMNQPYGAKVDVYSLSILMYQVLSLLQPFGNVPPSQFISSVIKGGLRPTIDASWPMELKDLLAKMWSSDSAQRPKSKDLVASLERMLRGTDDDLYPMSSLQRLFSGQNSMRSTPVYEMKENMYDVHEEMNAGRMQQSSDLNN
ncbi:hypothetical protein ACHAXR_000326, partial [Thalassiosira sp. AJA248-18]